MQLIDFEHPFIIGAFWAVIGTILFALLIVVVVFGWRRLSRYDHVLELQEREIAKNGAEIAVLQERARLIDAQRETDRQLATQQLANEQDRGAHYRFRTQGTATIVMALENWLRVALAALEKHNIPIETPPPWFGRRRADDEHFPAIEQARVERLQTMINEYKQSVGGLDWEISPSKEPTS